MAYTSCMNAIAKSIAQDCDAPLVGGYTGRGVLIPAASAYSITQDGTNPRLVVGITPESNTVVAIDNAAVIAPFDGSNTAGNGEAGVRQFAKTLAFRIPLRGGDVSKDIVEPLGNSTGYIAIVEKKDNGSVEGKFEVIGLQVPLTLNEDGVQRTEGENGGAIMATMSTTESWFEADLVGEKDQTSSKYTLAGAKTAFEALLAVAI